MPPVTRKQLKSDPTRQVQFDRLHLIGGAFFLVSLAIVCRLFDLQILKGAIKQAEAYTQRSATSELLPQRGEIYTIASVHQPTDLQPLAVNEKRFLVYANPRQVTQASATAKILAEKLELDVALLEQRLSLDDPYEPIKRAVPKKIADELSGLNLAGIYQSPEFVRFYPLADVFGHITGFVGFEGETRKGQYGMEGFLDRLLAGQTGYLESEQDPAGRLIAMGDRQFMPALDGSDFVLTIDPNIQQKVCDLIKDAQELYQAPGGSIIVMEPKSGAIRAMCSVPGFDPNTYGQAADADIFINPAISDAYEPGSIMKAITMAAGLDSGSVKADSFYTDTGQVVIGEHTIRNAANKVYGKQSMSQILENSVNTGAVDIAFSTGRKKLKEYFEAFGFGQPTGIEFPAEASGDISHLDEKGDIFLATSSFGQGITVTSMQVVRAFGAIANQGKLVQPRVLEKVIMPDGQELKFDSEKVVSKQVISSQTAAILSAMLVNVVEKGYDQRAKVAGFYLAGKTGTAQIAGPHGYTSDTIHTFAGFGPISNPQFVVLIKLDKPAWGNFSSNTIAPVFSELSSFLLQYYQVQPERANKN